MTQEKAVKAVIKISGREVLVNENDRFPTFNLGIELNKNFDLPAIISFDKDGNILNKTTTVTLNVEKNFLGKKVNCVKRKNRTRTFRTRGSRPHLTTVKVEKISISGGK